jgi:hypothetical protein
MQRSAPVRLTPSQRTELRDCLSRSLSNRLVADIEEALTLYRDSRKIQRHDNGSDHARSVSVKAAKLLLRNLHDGVYRELREQLKAFVMASHRPKGRPHDWPAHTLNILVMESLENAGIALTLTNRRNASGPVNTPTMEVLRLVRKWADRLDGHRRSPRKNIFEAAKRARGIVQHPVVGLFAVSEGQLVTTFYDPSTGRLVSGPSRPAELVHECGNDDSKPGEPK